MATKKGFVYILSNPSMPGLLKVGMTTKVPEKRADELSTTGVPEPFEVQYYAYFDDRAIAEEKAHIALSEYHHGKEFFKVDIETVIHAVENVGIPFIRLFIKDQSVASNPAESKAIDELTAKRIELEKIISERMVVERSIAARIEVKRKELQALEEIRDYKPIVVELNEAREERQRINQEWKDLEKKKAIFKKRAEKIIKQLNAEWKRFKIEKKKFTIVNNNKNNKLS